MRLFNVIRHDILRRPYRLVKSIDKGSGKNVLLIHGLGTDGNTWQPLLKQINTSKWRVLGYDLLGFGMSPKPKHSSYNVSEHTRSILASLDRKDKKGKMVIVGHSMGCLIASHIAWLRPEMVDRLILYEPPLFADSPEFRSHKRRRRFYFAFYNELIKRPKILLKYTKVLARISDGRILSIHPSSWHPFEKSLQNTIMNQKAYNELKAVEVPTDIIYGKFDFIVTRAEVKKMLRANQNVKFHLVKEMHEITDTAAIYIVSLLENNTSTTKG